MPGASSGTEDNKNEGNEFEDWKSSMLEMLSNVFHPRSISIVPDHLRKSNKDAYTPKVISIGPIHRKSKRDLIYMEEIKWLFMLSLLHRTDDPNETPCSRPRTVDASERLNECSEAMYRMDEVVRASYVDALKSFDRYELAKIMLLDGCFLLELLLGNNVELSAKLPCRLSPPPGPLDTRKKEEICSDLMVLENQIPQLVLYKLSAKLFPDHFTESDGKKRINDLVLSLFGYTPVPSSINTAYDAAHILELLHSFVTGKLGLGEPLVETTVRVTSSSSPGEVGIDVEKSTGGTVESRHEKKQLKGCATKLQASGVTINSLNSARAEGAGFDFDIKFSKGELKIPQLHITTTTKDKWMNFIAWEQNITNREEVRGGSSMISCKFSCYALFLRRLICCEHDIELLREKNVIVVHDDGNSTIQDKKKSKVMSNRELMLLVNYIADEVGDDNVDMIVNSGFGQLFDDSTKNLFRGMFIVFWHYFRYLLTSLRYKWENSYEILKIEYTPTVWKKIAIAYAVALLGLTIAQVALQAISI